MSKGLDKAQVERIETALQSHQDLDEQVWRPIKLSTVDAFQGAEREVIILSCVRTKQVGFLNNQRRINVAISRAKRYLLPLLPLIPKFNVPGFRHLILVGNTKFLASSNPMWREIIESYVKGKLSVEGYF